MRLPIENKNRKTACGGNCGCGCNGNQTPAAPSLGSLDGYVVMQQPDMDGENYMSVQALQSMKDHAGDLLSRVDHGTRLPDWVEAKLTRAAQSLNDVYEYMSHGKGQSL